MYDYCHININININSITSHPTQTTTQATENIMAILYSSREISMDTFSISSTKINTTVAKSPLAMKKAVRFPSSPSQLIQVHIIPATTTLTDEERRATWYSESESNAIIRENNRLLMRHRRNKFDDKDDARNYSLRGLEHLTGRERKTSRERVLQSVQKVITTQNKSNSCNCSYNNIITRSIAHKYMLSCQECCIEAFQRGLKDERVARTINTKITRRKRWNQRIRKECGSKKAYL
mmetsp:Transcript_2469/g.2768  ORF Transcript_2469/g.2768 Transcript_2469/m.2768 type:complete len:236 (-) Transcript_2469:115-822(-)